MKIRKKAVGRFFQDILEGKKRFEIRLADFEVNVGDILILEEIKDGKLTGRKIEKKVDYILKTKDLPFFSKEEIDKHGYQIIQLGE